MVLNKYDTLERLKEDQFGYSSVHFVVELPQSWLAVPTMKELTGLKAEIQLRTTAQHIWAEASKVLQYKNEGAVPSTLKRAIYRVSALLETVDLEFERVLSDREEYIAMLEASVPLSADELNVDTLQRVANDSWPSKNASDHEDWATLLVELHHFNIITAQRLIEIIGKWHDAALNHDVEVVGRIISGLASAYDDDDKERLRAGVYFSRVGLTRHVMELEFGQEYTDFREGLPSRLQRERMARSSDSD